MELAEFKCDVCPYKQKWIPVDRQRPKDGQVVLACTMDDWIGIVKYVEYDMNWDCGHYKAWMPLPEPYKERGEVK